MWGERTNSPLCEIKMGLKLSQKTEIRKDMSDGQGGIVIGRGQRLVLIKGRAVCVWILSYQL